MKKPGFGRAFFVPCFLCKRHPKIGGECPLPLEPIAKARDVLRAAFGNDLNQFRGV